MLLTMTYSISALILFEISLVIGTSGIGKSSASSTLVTRRVKAKLNETVVRGRYVYVVPFLL